MQEVQEASKLRSRDFREIIVGYALILIIVWTPNPLQRVLFWTAFAWIMYVTVAARPTVDELGVGLSFKLSSLLRSALLVSGAVVLAGVAILLAAKWHTLHELYGSAPAGRHIWGYVIWSFMQQFILQTYFLSRMLRLLPRPTVAVLVTAAMFSLAHLPNPLLTVATFLWGAAACLLFIRYRNFYSLGAVHAVLGLCIAFTVPNAIHHHMRVGLGYVRYHRDYPGQRPAMPVLQKTSISNAGTRSTKSRL